MICSFSAIVLLNICFGLYALYSFSEMSVKIRDTSEWTEGLLEIVQIQGGVAEVRRADLSYPFASNPALRDELMRLRREADKRASEVMESYRRDVETLEYDSEEQRQEDMRAIMAIIDGWGAYKAQSDALIKLWDENRAEEAAVAVNGASLKAYEKVSAEIDALAEYSAEQCMVVAEAGQVLYAHSVRIVLATLVVIALFSVGITLVLVRIIRRSMAELIRVAEAAGGGDLTVSSAISTGDEFGRISAQYNSMIDYIRRLVAQIQDSAIHLARSSEELNASAEQSAEGTRMIAENIERVSMSSENQRVDLETTSTELERMSMEIVSTGETIEASSRSALDAVDKAREGEQAMERAVSQMNLIEQTVDASAQVVVSLGERSNEIGQIVETISGIASQTNLLALNAAIEAARAGEHGRGFAVVADQVKKLAGESQVAAEEIAKLISSIQSETDRAVAAMTEGRNEVRVGSEAVGEGGRAFGDLAAMSVGNSEKLEEIVSTMHGLSSSAEKLVASAHNVENASRRISDDSQSIVAATEEQAASMNEVSNASGTLAEISQEMLDATKRFVIE